jgi:hypothetical protein
MKFGKRLKQQVQDTLPEWRDKFLSYKELKKLLRLLSTAPTSLLNGSSIEYGKAEAEFMYLLNNEIEKFNGFFMEQEEDFIIRHKVHINDFQIYFYKEFKFNFKLNYSSFFSLLITYNVRFLIGARYNYLRNNPLLIIIKNYLIN